jgi:hypothetical protein
MEMKAWQLLSGPDKFCKGELAQNREGENVYANSLAAVRWCLVGAIIRCYPEPIRDELLDRIKRNVKAKCIAVWNDRYGWRKVRAVLKKLDI